MTRQCIAAKISRVADAPIRDAPATIIANAAAVVRMPPLAFTPMLSPTVSRMIATDRSVAPPAL